MVDEESKVWVHRSPVRKKGTGGSNRLHAPWTKEPRGPMVEGDEAPQCTERPLPRRAPS